MSTQDIPRPEPGKWWCLFSCTGAIGTRYFILRDEPVLRFYENGFAYLTADENLIVTSADTFQVFWKYYHPADGESARPINPKEIAEFDAIQPRSDAPAGNQGSEPPTPSTTE